MNRQWKQLLIGLLVVCMAQTIYGLVQSATRGTFDLMTDLDRALPFMPGWIWIYVSIFPVFIFAAAGLEEGAFKRTLQRVILAQLLTFPFFFRVPADYPRPLMVDDGTFYGWAYALMHRIDGANNTFPSLHVSMTWIIIYELGKTVRARQAGMLYAVLVSASVLFTKQHFIVDVLGGYLVYRLTLFAITRPLNPQRPS